MTRSFSTQHIELTYKIYIFSTKNEPAIATARYWIFTHVVLVSRETDLITFDAPPTFGLQIVTIVRPRH